MPASDKQLAANRANAAHSTGPRTPEAKDRSKMNAVTHGLRAQTAVLPGEDASQLEELSAELMRQLRPTGIVQRLLAERVVSLAWKLRRVARAEAVVAEQMEQEKLRDWRNAKKMHRLTHYEAPAYGPKPVPRDAATLLAESFEATETGGRSEGRLLRLSQYELKLESSLRAAVRDLLKLQKQQVVEEEAAEVEAEAPPAPAEPNEPGAGPPAAATGNVDAASVAEFAGERTNPIPQAPDSAEVVGITTVTAESSSPAPGTFASPPPGPRP